EPESTMASHADALSTTPVSVAAACETVALSAVESLARPESGDSVQPRMATRYHPIACVVVDRARGQLPAWAAVPSVQLRTHTAVLTFVPRPGEAIAERDRRVLEPDAAQPTPTSSHSKFASLVPNSAEKVT